VQRRGAIWKWIGSYIGKIKKIIQIKVWYFADKMKALWTEYNDKEEKTFEDILDFHVNNQLFG